MVKAATQNKEDIVALEITEENSFRIYKVEVSPFVRKDGFQLVKSFGCNGRRHVINYDHIMYANIDEVPTASAGRSEVKPHKDIGPCDHHSCKNLGFFIITK